MPIIHIDDDFDLEKIQRSGQCFRVKNLYGGYYQFIHGRHVLLIKPAGCGQFNVSVTEQAWEQIWASYFNLERNYRAARAVIPQEDAFLQEAAAAGAGIRILRQDPYEMLLTFVISQRKSIPAITSIVEAVSEEFGATTMSGGAKAFPTLKRSAELTNDFVWDEFGAGYRAPYLAAIVSAARRGEVDFEALAALPTDELLASLMKLPGVGIKVASCVALFGFGRHEAAPVDTWMQRIFDTYYGGETPSWMKGADAGILQQYVFYWALQNKKTLKALSR